MTEPFPYRNMVILNY